MEMSEDLSISSSRSRSSVIAAGFPVGRRNIRVLKWNRNRSMKSKKKIRVKGLIWSMPWHAVFAFLNPLLIGVLQVKYQGKGNSPFDNHHGLLCTFLLATLLYCFAFAANIKCRRHRTNYALLSGHVTLISGSLSSVSLVYILLPHLLGKLIFYLGIFLPVVVSGQSILFICRWTYQWVSRLVYRLHDLVVVNLLDMEQYGNHDTQFPV